MEKLSRAVVSTMAILLFVLPYKLGGMTEPLDMPGDKVNTAIVSAARNGMLPIGDFQIEKVNMQSALSNIRKSDRKTGGGGPDSYGYTWLDSDTAGGPVYSWIEISSFGTRIEDFEWQGAVNPLDDGTAGPFPMGFPFFYERSMFDSIYIGTNGALSFTCGDLTRNGLFYGGSVPGLQFPDALVPFWNDLNLDTTIYGGGDVYYWSNGVDLFIVEYLDVKPWVTEPTVDAVTFEIILSGIDSSVTFQYQTVETPSSSVDLDSSATIGIQDFTTRLGLGYFNGNSGGPLENLPHADLAVEFKKVTTYTHNIALGYFYPVPNYGAYCFVEGYEPIDPWAQVVNTGASMEPAVPVRVEADSSGFAVYSDEVILSNVGTMEEDTAFFATFAPAQGVYELRCHADVPGDVFPQDDSGKVTICAQKTFYASPFRSIEPTIDGIIQNDEWTDAVEIDISRIGCRYPWVPWPPESLGSAFVYAKQDSQYLFLAFDILVDTNDTQRDHIALFFDDNHNGEYEADSSEGHLSFANSIGATMDTIYFVPRLDNNQWADTSYLVEDLERGFRNNNGHQQAELKMPFGTAEFWHLNTSIDDTLAMHLYYRDRSDSIYLPEFDMWVYHMIGLWPIKAVYVDPTNFGEIVLSSEGVGVAEQESIKDGIALEVFPNPCNHTMTLYYSLNIPGNGSIHMFDIAGRKVATLVGERTVEASGSLSFQLKSLPTGIYFVRMEAERGSTTRKVILLR